MTRREIHVLKITCCGPYFCPFSNISFVRMCTRLFLICVWLCLLSLGLFSIIQIKQLLQALCMYEILVLFLRLASYCSQTQYCLALKCVPSAKHLVILLLSRENTYIFINSSYFSYWFIAIHALQVSFGSDMYCFNKMHWNMSLPQHGCPFRNNFF